MWSTHAEVEICTDAGLLHLCLFRQQAHASWKSLMEVEVCELAIADLVGVEI